MKEKTKKKFHILDLLFPLGCLFSMAGLITLINVMLQIDGKVPINLSLLGWGYASLVLGIILVVISYARYSKKHITKQLKGG